jgi:hypothetical protein
MLVGVVAGVLRDDRVLFIVVLRGCERVIGLA